MLAKTQLASGSSTNVPRCSAGCSKIGEDEFEHFLADGVRDLPSRLAGRPLRKIGVKTLQFKRTELLGFGHSRTQAQSNCRQGRHR
jgi:hypothetical protein